MQLESGIRISVLPHFRPTLLTRAELCLNSGFERRQSRFKARHDWRPPTEQERRILTAPEEMYQRTRSIGLSYSKSPATYLKNGAP
jgi:hypothetical protein